jgi:pimeloyl-ACP methyl ester carboxylesterase
MLKPALSILFLFFLFPTSKLFSQEPEKPFPNSRFIILDSIRVHYRTWDPESGNPRGNVFFVHGFAGSTFCFRDLYDTLAALGFRVVAADIPGAGYSEKTTNFNQSHSNRARFLWDLTDNILPGDTIPWYIVGHSMGGGTAEAMAIMRKEKTARLILVAGAVFRKTNNMISTMTFLVRQKKVKKLIINYADKNLITCESIGKLLKSAYKRLPDSSEVTGYCTPLREENSAEALINIYTNNKEIADLDVRTMTGVPVLAIWGTRDSWVPLRSARIYFSAFPDLRLVKIKGAGHMPMETHLEEFLPVFLEFLQ